MKLYTLIENTTTDDSLACEHGLSLYIEANGHRILFDAGQSGAFADNAEKMGIDLRQVDMCILSHGHYDHGGGLKNFLRINSKAPVYVHRRAFGAHYNGKEKYIGLDPSLLQEPRLIFTEGTVRLLPHMVLTDCGHPAWQSNAWGLTRRTGDTWTPDDFRHEQYLLITEGQKRILISGCSHRGIVNIAEHFQPDVLIGGFHLNKLEDPRLLGETAERLLKTGTRYYTGHCTGDSQYDAIKAHLKDKLGRISTGTVLEL